MLRRMGGHTTPSTSLSSSLSTSARRWLHRRLPDRLVDAARVGLGRARVADPERSYERLYESHAQALPSDSSIGDGDFDLVGRVELSVLIQEGLTPSSTLLDLGCGTGRLSVHAIPYLSDGRYIGTDISPTMLRIARERLGDLGHRSSVEWIHQPDETFPAADGTVDMICAFSVLTHMEHEDALRYLRAARRVVRPQGRLVLSCLPIHLAIAKQIFLAAAAVDAEVRWSKVRDVTTSTELMETVAELAGWRPIRWHDGEVPSIQMFDEDRLMPLGQSILVAE
jgi:SAM-dependent methyltransferase